VTQKTNLQVLLKPQSPASFVRFCFYKIFIHTVPEYTNSAPLFFRIVLSVPNAVSAVSTPESLRTNTINPVTGDPP